MVRRSGDNGDTLTGMFMVFAVFVAVAEIASRLFVVALVGLAIALALGLLRWLVDGLREMHWLPKLVLLCLLLRACGNAGTGG